MRFFYILLAAALFAKADALVEGTSVDQTTPSMLVQSNEVQSVGTADKRLLRSHHEPASIVTRKNGKGFTHPTLIDYGRAKDTKLNTSTGDSTRISRPWKSTTSLM
ncbi:unnamed protein product [Phytophthora lilii]|uniref:RxLR effector protein n=1 Tax=Phytophthora lilii TaxID=2077276 RepID=A0A9W6X2V3_9STRA|nr:unnamed protein product [Phytophthora lilii]